MPIQSYVAGLFALGSGDRLLLRHRAGLDAVHGPRRQHYPWTSPRSRRASRCPPTRRASLQSIYTTTSAYSAGVPAGRLAAGAAADPERLDRRPVPARAGAPRLQLPALALRQGFPVSLQFGDLGHSRGSNKAATNAYFYDQAREFFARAPEAWGGRPRRRAP